MGPFVCLAFAETYPEGDDRPVKSPQPARSPRSRAPRWPRLRPSARDKSASIGSSRFTLCHVVSAEHVSDTFDAVRYKGLRRRKTRRFDEVPFGDVHATAASRTVAAMIHATPIRRDAEGRYCLNDLHKAAGGELKHRPVEFMRLASTKALADAISKSGDSHLCPIDLSRGRYGGTYVHKMLALDYAAWVSPEFKLAVYRTLKGPQGNQWMEPRHSL